MYEIGTIIDPGQDAKKIDERLKDDNGGIKKHIYIQSPCLCLNAWYFRTTVPLGSRQSFLLIDCLS